MALPLRGMPSANDQVPNMKPYLSVVAPHSCEKVIERSRFIASCAHAEGEEQARAFVAGVRTAHSLATHNCFAFIADDAGNLLGEIDITKLRHIVFRTELYHHFKVKQLMSQPEAVLSVNDTMEEVMKRFDATDSTMLPVLDGDSHLLGYISRTHMYAMYRKMVADLSED